MRDKNIIKFFKLIKFLTTVILIYICSKHILWRIIYYHDITIMQVTFACGHNKP